MSDPMLPKGLQDVLASIVDRELAGRMTRVGLAAARCIDQLQAINLLSLEPTSAEEGSADLSLWEQMAPAVADTVATISGLCGVIDQEFPETLSRAGVYSSESSDERAEAEAALVFRAVGSLLKGELAQVRDMVRRPELMASQWSLLEELQRLRAHFRRRVGDAVYLSTRRPDRRARRRGPPSGPPSGRPTSTRGHTPRGAGGSAQPEERRDARVPAARPRAR
jgi:hypothetical protein